MKPRLLSIARLSFPLASAIAALIAAPAAWAASPYTWTANTAATQTWTTAGNWLSSNVDSGPGTATDTLNFFADITTALVNGNNVITTSVPALTMNVLTLNGKGAAATGASNITIGTNATTWTLDGTSPTVNLNGVNGTQALAYTTAVNLALTQTNTTFTGNGTASFNFSGVIGGLSKAVTKSGSSTLTLSNTNTYTGGTTVTAGTLRGNVAGAFGANTTSSAISLGGGTLELFNNTATTFTNTNTTVTATSTVSANRSSSAATSTTHTLGTLSIGAQTLNVTRGGNITTTGTGGITFGATTLTGDATFAPGASAQLSLGAVGGAFKVTKSGAGALILTAADAYSGGTAISAGLLQVNNATGLGTAAVTISDGRVRINNGVTITNNITVNSGVAGVASSGLVERNTGTAGVARVNGIITLNGTPTGGGTFYNNVNTTGSELYLAGAINGSAIAMSQRDGRIIYAGGGSIAGNFTVTGTAVVGAANGIPVALTHLLGGSGSATLDLNGFDQALAGIQLGNATNSFTSTVNVRNGTLTLNGNISNVTVNTQAVTHLFTGTTGGINVGSTLRTLDVVNGTAAEDVIFDLASISGTGGITKNGLGTLSIGHTGGTVNMTGPLTIAAGELLIGRPNTANTLNVGSISFSSGTTLNVNVGTGGDRIIAGAAVSAGTTVQISQFGGALVVGNNYPILSYSGTSPGISNFTSGPLPGHLAGTLVDTGSAIALNVTGNDKIIWNGTNNTAWATGVTGNWKLQTGGAPTDFFHTDDVIFPDSPVNSTVDIATAVLPSNVAITNTIATSYTFTGAGGIAGTTGITKTGDGTTILRTPTPYTGATTINAGKLEFDYDGGTTLSATSGITIADVATLGLTRDGTATTATSALSRSLSGNGTVEVNMRTGAAAAMADGLSVTGANTGFSGNWVLKAPATGTYRLQDATPASLGSAAIAVESGAQVYAPGNQTYANNITIAGTGFADSGGFIGALRLDSNTIWAGNITVAAGGARIGAHNVTATISGSISGGDLNVNGSDGNFNNAYTIIFTGANSHGKTTIGGGSTATAVSSRRLNIGNGGTTGTLGAGVVEITGDAQNGILGFDRSNGYTLAAGQTITGVGATLARTYIDVDSPGAGFSNAGNAINLGTADPNTGGGGFIRIGMTRAASVANLDGNVTAGRLYVTGNVAGNGSIANFNSGLLGSFGYVTLSEASSGNGTVNHNTGAVVNILTQLRVGHFGTETSTYNMNGGVLTMTGASPLNTPSTVDVGSTTVSGDGNLNITNPTTLVGGGIYLGVDGTGVFNHTGGTVTTNWIVLDNRGATGPGANMPDGLDRYNLSGAGSVLNLRSSWGLIGRNEGSYAVSFGGGTVIVDNSGSGTGTGPNITVPLDATINTVAATTTNLDTNGAGNGFTLTKGVLGTGTLNLTGGGLINLSAAAIQNISATLTGTAPITKLGAGTTTLAGTASGYTGNVTVSAGRLNLPDSLGAGNLTVADGAAIAGEPVLVNTLTLGSTLGSTVFFDPNTSGALTTSSLVVNGTNTIDLTAIPGGTGPYTVINYTSKSGSGGFAIANPLNYRVTPIVDDVTGNKVSLTVTGQVDLTWTGAVDAKWDINNTANWNNPTPASDKFFSADRVTFPEGAGNTSIALTGLLAPGSIAVTATSTAYTFTATTGNQIVGATGITKTGGGTLSLIGANAYTGITSIGGGTVVIDGTNSIGSAAVGNTLGISGGGRLSYTAATALDLGTNRNIAVGTDGGSISHNNATAATISIPGKITCSGSDTLSFHSNAAGAGTFVLSGDNSGFTGKITVDAPLVAGGLTALRLANQSSVPAGGSITLNFPAAGVAGNATTLDLQGVTLPGGLTLYMTAGFNGVDSVRTQVTGVGVINSPVKVSGTSIVQFNTAGTMTHNGGFSEGPTPFSNVVFFRGAGTHLVNCQLNLPTAGSKLSVTDGATVVVSSTGNVWSGTDIANGTVRLTANDALATSATLSVGQGDANSPSCNLNGFNQTVGGLIHVPGTGGNKTVTNSAATLSTLTVNQAVDATWGGLTSGNLALVKAGIGNLTFSNAANSYSGNFTVNEGVVTATGVSSGTNSTLGLVNSSRTISVNTPAALNLTTNNILGNGATNPNLPSLVVNGSTVSTGHYNVLGNTTLNGGTLSQTSIATGNYHGFQLRGNVTVIGTVPSAITTTNTRGTHLGSNTTFTVNDATGDPAVDLVVSSQLVDQSGDFASAAGGFTKSGSGTMSLSGANTYTGATTVNVGTLALVGGSQASPVTVNDLASLGFTLDFPTTTTSTVTFNAGSTIKITGTPTLSSYTLITSSAGITGTPVLHTPITGYSLRKAGNALVLENPYLIWADANSVTGGKFDDDDGDTFDNLMEFGFGTDPKVGAWGPITYSGLAVTGHGQPVLVDDAGVYYAVFGRRTDYLAAGLTYTVEFSADMGVWTPTVIAPTTLATDGVIDAVRVPFLNIVPSNSGPQKPTFFKVGVSQ